MNFSRPAYVAKEAGTRYAITHGGVTDYALVSEGTDFGIVGVEAGKAFFKITVFGNDLSIYTPYIERPTSDRKKSECHRANIEVSSNGSKHGPMNTSRKTAMSAPAALSCQT